LDSKQITIVCIRFSFNSAIKGDFEGCQAPTSFKCKSYYVLFNVNVFSVQFSFPPPQIA